MHLARLAPLASLALGLAVLFAAFAAPPALAQDGGFHVDNKYGFKLRPPKEWAKIPLKLDEEWQVAKYLSDKSYFFTEKNGGWTYEHKPEMLVIAFVSAVVRERTTVKKEKKEGEEKIQILIKNPYKDYLDYLKRTYSDGGYYVAEETESKVENVNVTQYQIKVEKLTQTGPKRIVCWVFHTEEVDYAVHFEVLEEQYDKLKQTLNTTLKSFRLIPRTEGGMMTPQTGENAILEDIGTLTPEERRIKRQTRETSLHERAKKSTPNGWQVAECGRFLVISHGDEKYAKRIAEQLECVIGWLEQTFPFVGPDEYVCKPILRVCASLEEEMSFRKGGDGFWFSDSQIEIVTCQMDEGFSTDSWSVERANRQMLTLWFTQRDRDMWWAMPNWLKGGLYQLIGTARAKGNKLEFKVDDWERDGIRERVREGKASSPRELMKMNVESFASGGGQEWWGRNQEVGGLVRFFVTGPASKNPKTKDVLRDYIKNLHAVVVEIESELKAGAGKEDDKPKTEAEEEERFKRDSQSWKAREKRVLESTYERTFRSWSEKQWQEFEDVYFRTVS
jgi:hypothetical protein